MSEKQRLRHDLTHFANTVSTQGCYVSCDVVVCSERRHLSDEASDISHYTTIIWLSSPCLLDRALEFLSLSLLMGMMLQFGGRSVRSTISVAAMFLTSFASAVEDITFNSRRRNPMERRHRTPLALWEVRRLWWKYLIYMVLCRDSYSELMC